MRTLLPEDERILLEQALVRLAPLFDLRSTHPADGALTAKQGVPEALASVSAATVAAVAAGHSVVEEQAAAGCERADALAQAAADGAAQLVAATPGAGAEGAPAAGGEQQAAVGPAGAPTPTPSAPTAAKALAGLQADGVRSLAELCSLCLERLLALGRSLSAFYRYGKPADDRITWPPSCEACGLLLRAQALRMLEELQAMGGAYGAALSQAGEGLAGGWGASGMAACFRRVLACCANTLLGTLVGRGPESTGRSSLRLAPAIPVSITLVISLAHSPVPASSTLQAASWMRQQAARHTAKPQRRWCMACRQTAMRLLHE